MRSEREEDAILAVVRQVALFMDNSMGMVREAGGLADAEEVAMTQCYAFGAITAISKDACLTSGQILLAATLLFHNQYGVPFEKAAVVAKNCSRATSKSRYWYLLEEGWRDMIAWLGSDDLGHPVGLYRLVQLHRKSSSRAAGNPATPKKASQPGWLSRQFANTPLPTLRVAGFCMAPIMLMLSVVVLLTSKHPLARRNAGVVCLVSGGSILLIFIFAAAGYR